ncbi:Hypothetical protein HEAR2387 [Herminiimonas arsenicoxydans]|uniref:Uncharacterized protein n=1 Tax=Herminiimonas arsenicoxydans TaxID=204773 RepID=A4G7N1_HERAR|nr:Hypothetical protein HEAR2387 [Herminiimonas arsenicoxydans]
MTTEQIYPADMVSLDREFGLCNLIIVDHAPWDEVHLLSLEARLNACLQWVESGEIYLVHPAAQACEFVFNLQFIYAPDAQACAFLNSARDILDEAGYSLYFGPLGSSYADEVEPKQDS